MVLVKQLRSTFLMQLNAPSDQSITSFVLLDGDRLNVAELGRWLFETKLGNQWPFALESIHNGVISYKKHGIGLARAGMEPTNKGDIELCVT